MHRVLDGLPRLGLPARSCNASWNVFTTYQGCDFHCFCHGKGSDLDGVAVQDFNIEKLQLLESEKAKIRKEYERREGQIEVKKKM